MGSGQGTEGRRLQFTIQTALLAMVLVAVVFALYSAHRRNRELSWRLLRAQSEIQNQKSRTEFDEKPKGKMFGKGGLSSVCLDGVNLRGISISGGRFQLASFKNSDLRGTTLIGGASSFQGALFDNANLATATLTGGGASFQLASFVNADLSGAVLTGCLQGASFEGAKLIDARVVVSRPADFQAVNIDGAEFQGADLSTIDPNSLESCYFDTAPLYDKKTRFPNGFDPAAQGWARAK